MALRMLPHLCNKKVGRQVLGVHRCTSEHGCRQIDLGNLGVIEFNRRERHLHFVRAVKQKSKDKLEGKNLPAGRSILG